MSIEATNKILTQEQFKQSPLNGKMSYADYVQTALKLGSTFTVARALNLYNAQQTSDNISESISGWYVEREAKKDEAEARYYAALAQYNASEETKYVAERKVEYATNMFGEDSFQYKSAMKKLTLFSNQSFNANIELSCARDHFNSANKNAFNAYLTTRALDA